jgi:hypothetical protein
MESVKTLILTTKNREIDTTKIVRYCFCRQSRFGVVMMEFYTQHFSEIWSFIGGLVSGGLGGSFFTLNYSRQHRVGESGTIIDQSGASAQGDIVGGNKTHSRN